MSTFSPPRLTLARRRRGLTMKDVADTAGVSRRTVTAWEAGEFPPSDPAVQRLAALLGFPAEFFFANDIDELAVEAATFRALTAASARQVHRVTSAATLACEISDWITARFVPPVVDLPDLSELAPDDAATALRRYWLMGERPAGNMIHLMEAHGVRVFSLAEDVREIDAFSLWRDGVPHVFLNPVKSAEHSRFDAAHELGHLVLHKGTPTVRSKTYEHQANAFAAAFLMPEPSIYAKVRGFVDLGMIMKYKRYWRVSAATLTQRLHRLKLLTDWAYRSIMIELTRLGHLVVEPNGAQRETSQLLPKVFSALRARGITRAKLAVELRISESELDSLVFGLMLLPLSGSGGRVVDGHDPRVASGGRAQLRLVRSGG